MKRGFGKVSFPFFRYVWIVVVAFVFFTNISDVHSQINTNRVLSIGKNALYFEDYVLSIQYFNQVIRVRPHLPEPYFYRAVAKISLEDYRGAEEDCTLALERNPFLSEAYRCRGIARVYLGKITDATADFDKGLEFSPESKSLLLCKGYASMQNENYDQAVADFSVSIEKYPKLKEAYLNRGFAYMQKEDTLKALKDFETVLRLDPFNADGHAAKGYVLYIQEKYKESLSEYDESIRVEPYRTGYYLNRGIVRYKMMDLRGAMADYDHVITLDPYNTNAYYNRGLLRSEVGDRNRAVEDFDRVIEIEPDNYFAIYNRAIIQGQLGNLSKAIQDYTTIIKEFPDFFPAYYGRGEAKMKRNDKLGAEKDYNMAMLLRQRKITKKDILKTDTTNTTRKKTDKNLQNHNKLVVADNEEQMRRLTYKNESRGRVQNVNFNIEQEPNFIMSYYPTKKDNVRKTSYYDKKLDIYNQKKENKQNLYLTNNEERPSNQVENAFSLIEKLSDEIAENPTAELFFKRALQFEFISDYDSAIEDLGKAIEVSKQEEKWIYYFARANSRTKKFEYEHSLKDDIEVEQEKMTMDYYTSKVSYDMIIEDYEKTSALYPEFPFSWFNRGNLMSVAKDYLNAIANYTKSIEEDNSFAEAYFNRGLCYLKVGENEKGIKDLGKAGELGIYVAYNVIKRYRE